MSADNKLRAEIFYNTRHVDFLRDFDKRLNVLFAEGWRLHHSVSLTDSEYRNSSDLLCIFIRTVEAQGKEPRK